MKINKSDEEATQNDVKDLTNNKSSKRVVVDMENLTPEFMEEITQALDKAEKDRLEFLHQVFIDDKKFGPLIR